MCLHSTACHITKNHRSWSKQRFLQFIELLEIQNVWLKKYLLQPLLRQVSKIMATDEIGFLFLSALIYVNFLILPQLRYHHFCDQQLHHVIPQVFQFDLKLKLTLKRYAFQSSIQSILLKDHLDHSQPAEWY